jgi:hypothetical protein
MIRVWGCACGYWRRQRMEDLGLLTQPRCPWCGQRMQHVLRATRGLPEPREPSLEEIRQAYRPEATRIPTRAGSEPAGAETAASPARATVRAS